MRDCAERESEEPGSAITPVEVNSDSRYQDEKNEGMAKYPAVTEGFSKEKMTDRFINDIRQEGSYEDKPDVDTVYQVSEP